jgi:hypothetical protein
MMNDGTHGTAPRNVQIVPPSNRSVGLTFGAALAVAALLPLWRGEPVRVGAMAAAGTFCVVAAFAPKLLGPLTWIWFHIGLAMHRIVNPLVTAALFFLVLTPFALVMRLLRRGPVRQLRQDPAATSYWIRRNLPFSPMDRQF